MIYYLSTYFLCVTKGDEYMKKTKIICSIGPASCNTETMTKMVLNGMNTARINFSHATMEERENVVRVVNEVRKNTGLYIGILYDTKGPEFRNGYLENNSIKLVEGKTIRMVKEDVLGTEERFSVNHPKAIDSLKVGDTVLLENGLMKIEVISKEDDGVTCKIINGGVLGNKKSLSVPGVHLDIPFISKEDDEDIRYACNHEGDFLALSFVSTKEDVLEAKKIIDEENSDIKIISKIESTTGIDNLSEIVSVSDGIMVARGDLGVEAPMEAIPYLQKEIIDECRRQNKFCIVATEMLESMKHNARPTRAEVSDIFNAIINGTDAVMLSGETTTGKYPVETVNYMSNICSEAEKHFDYKYSAKYIKKDIAGAIANSVFDAANLLDTKLIVAATMSGNSARLISNLRPRNLILATVPNEKVAYSLALNSGVYPVVTEIYDSTDRIIEDAKNKSKEFMKLEENDMIIVTGGFPNDTENKKTNFMKIEEI